MTAYLLACLSVRQFPDQLVSGGEHSCGDRPCWGPAGHILPSDTLTQWRGGRQSEGKNQTGQEKDKEGQRGKEEEGTTWRGLNGKGEMKRVFSRKERELTGGGKGAGGERKRFCI